MSDFLMKFAENPKEIESAQRLRFEVFNLEMKRGLACSYATGLDQDKYDSLCDHLIIIDRKRDLTIGTYRLLLRSRLDGRTHFYSENEFDLANIRKLKGEILEIGRSCVHKDYRKNSIIHLLWSGIIEYVQRHRVQYITGCPSLYTTNPVEISKIYVLMKKFYFAHQTFRVYPKHTRVVSLLNDHLDIKGEEKRIFLKLPSLVRSYLKVGARVCGAPAMDAEFNTVDFFILLDVRKISDNYLKRLRIRRIF